MLKTYDYIAGDESTFEGPWIQRTSQTASAHLDMPGYVPIDKASCLMDAFPQAPFQGRRWLLEAIRLCLA
jgi:hypothetical protein